MCWSFNLFFPFLIELFSSFSGELCLKVSFSPVLHGSMTFFRVSFFYTYGVTHFWNLASIFCEDTLSSASARDPRWELALHQKWLTLYRQPVSHCRSLAGHLCRWAVERESTFPFIFQCRAGLEAPCSLPRSLLLARCVVDSWQVSGDTSGSDCHCWDIAWAFWQYATRGWVQAVPELLSGGTHASDGPSHNFPLPGLCLCCPMVPLVHISKATEPRVGFCQAAPLDDLPDKKKGLLTSSEVGRGGLSV